MGHVAKQTLKIDGHYYAPGDPVELKDKSLRKQLVDAGAIEPAPAAEEDAKPARKAAKEE